MRHLLVLLASVVVLSASSAGPVIGTGSLGSFNGSFDYDSMTQRLTIALTNDSIVVNGGYLVAFAFNLPDNVTISGYTPSAGGSSFGLLGGPEFQGGVSVAPYGSADVGASVGGGWEGGGSPTAGLAVGESATWAFVLSGNTDGLTTESLFDEKTSDGGPGLLVRFRGFTNAGSDKVAGVLVDEQEPGGTVDTPEPGTLVLAAVAGGVGLVGGLRRWRRKLVVG